MAERKARLSSSQGQEEKRGKEVHYTVQYATTGVSGCSCAACKKKTNKETIPKGHLRVGWGTYGAFGDPGRIIYHWYYPKHFFETRKTLHARDPPSSVEEWEGFDQLNLSDRNYIRKELQHLLAHRASAREKRKSSTLGSSKDAFPAPMTREDYHPVYTEPLGTLIRRLSSNTGDEDTYSWKPSRSDRKGDRTYSPPPTISEEEKEEREEEKEQEEEEVETKTEKAAKKKTAASKPPRPTKEKKYSRRKSSEETVHTPEPEPEPEVEPELEEDEPKRRKEEGGDEEEIGEEKAYGSSAKSGRTSASSRGKSSKSATYPKRSSAYTNERRSDEENEEEPEPDFSSIASYEEEGRGSDEEEEEARGKGYERKSVFTSNTSRRSFSASGSEREEPKKAGRAGKTRAKKE